MSANLATNLIFNNNDIDQANLQNFVQSELAAYDDGEIFIEFEQSEHLSFDDGRIRSAGFDTSSGFGLRGVIGETTGYAYSSDITMDSVKRAASSIRSVRQGVESNEKIVKLGAPLALYDTENPINEFSFEKKVELLQAIDSYVRSKSSLVKQVSASINAEWQVVVIMSRDGSMHTDIRPLVRLGVSVTLEKNGRLEAANYGCGGRVSSAQFFDPNNWKAYADEAYRVAELNLDSILTPAGEMPVILGNGWPGILLHEAVGHGLEGDFNRKKTSNFSGLIGKRVAAKGVTVIDDGTIANRRGSLNMDDEGTPTTRNVLIEDGILVNYLQDRQNARLMGMKPTGSGRRESYAYQPMPRMTNTFMENGTHDAEEIIKSVDKGIYAVSFSGGQVDITSGKFVFVATEAYLVEKGKIVAPVKGATFIGNGPDVMKKVKMIGNDLTLDPGIGTCGKNGQSVPVGVGQPTLLIESMTVGGTETE